MLDAPATPPPQVSDSEMETEEEERLLGRDADNNDSSDEDGFQHV